MKQKQQQNLKKNVSSSDSELNQKYTFYDLTKYTQHMAKEVQRDSPHKIQSQPQRQLEEKNRSNQENNSCLWREKHQ